MKVTYIPSKDELILTIQPVSKRRPNKRAGHLRIWWSKEKGEIYALAIEEFSKELETFQKCRGLIPLGGLWKGLQITEDDIQKARETLLKELEAKW